MMDDIEQLSGVRLGAGTLYGAITRLAGNGGSAAWIRRIGANHTAVQGSARGRNQDTVAWLNELQCPDNGGGQRQ